MRSITDDHGYAMAALLVALAVMGVLMSMALPVWETAARREKEAELIFRGEQYARAVTLFQQRFGGTYPPNVDVLVTERLLRKKYLDPITGKDFEIITPASAIAGSAVPGGPGGVLAGAAAGRETGGRTGGAGARQGGTAATQAGRGAAPTPLSAQTGGLSTQRGRGAGAGQVGASAGVLGVRSTSTDRALRVYNGAETYDQWLFIGTQASTAAGGGAEGSDTPGAGPGGRGGADEGRGGRGGRGGRADGRGGRGGRGGEGRGAGQGGGRGPREGGGGGFRQGGGGRGGRGL